ncbi:hypothetical protein KJ885_04955 [Patescibacteria group bacterium]|nr:hypothetical protein [Patescibacteria group bacterium]
MAPYRESGGFHCTAGELLDLFLMFDGQEILRHKSSLIKEIKVIYGETAVIGFSDILFLLFVPAGIWRRFKCVIEFGKEHGILKRDWLLAIEQISAGG